MNRPPLHQKEALRLLQDGEPHTIRFWKLSSGEIVELQHCTYINHQTRRGTHTVRINASGQLRKLRDITLHNIDGHTIYL